MCLHMLGSKQPKEILVFWILKLLFRHFGQYMLLWTCGSYKRILCSCSNNLEHILDVAFGDNLFSVAAKGGFSDTPGIIYRGILSPCS